MSLRFLLTPGLLLAALTQVVAEPVAAWDFSGAAGRSLADIPRLGLTLAEDSERWDNAIPALATTASALRIQNDGTGGAGVRSAFAGFIDPGNGDALVLEAGTYTVELTLSAWSFAPDAEGARLGIDLIKSNWSGPDGGTALPFSPSGLLTSDRFALAGLALRVGANELSVAGHIDPLSDGTAVEPLGGFPLNSNEPLTLWLRLDLDDGTYVVAARLGEEGTTQVVGSGEIDSSGGPVHALRLSVAGDYTQGGTSSYLDLAELKISSGDTIDLPSAPTGFAAWLIEAEVPADQQGPTDDPDRDGVNNLLEYALGGNPTDGASTERLPQFRTDSDGFFFQFPRQARHDLRYTVESSSTLALDSWTAIWESTGLENTEALITVRPDSNDPTPRSFLRLRITLLPED